jgi:hypothetical protein
MSNNSVPNVPEVQILFDTGDKLSVKVVGYYTSATNSNSMIIAANTLNYANSSRPCVLSLVSAQYSAGFANGYIQLQWIGKGSGGNADIIFMGGKSAGQFVGYTPNPLASNTANLNGNAGDVGLSIVGAAPQDAFTLYLNFNKEGGAMGGYSNVYTNYNDPGFAA